MKTLEVIFFDIDDTLYSTTGFAQKARYGAIDEMIRAGLDTDRETCYSILMEIVDEFSSNDSRQFDKLLSRLPDSATKGTNRLIIIAAGVFGYHNTKFKELTPFPDVSEYLPRIANLGIDIGVISSGIGIKQAEKLVRLGLVHCFSQDIIFITDDIGIGKSNKKIFFKACSTAGVVPQHAIHVGDNPATDVDTAHKAGLITVQRKGSGKHADEASVHTPDYTVNDFGELLDIIRNDFDAPAQTNEAVPG